MFLVLTALFTLVAFSGELISDTLADKAVACAPTSSQQAPADDGCPHCSCPMHHASILIPDGAPLLMFAASQGTSAWLVDSGAPAALARSIDHPPQLA